MAQILLVQTPQTTKVTTQPKEQSSNQKEYPQQPQQKQPFKYEELYLPF